MPSFVKKSVDFTWEGKDYPVAITNELANTLESIDINIWALYVESLRASTPKVFLLSNFIANVLRASAGVDVVQDDVLKFIMNNPQDAVKLINQSSQALAAFFPPVEIDEEKPVGKPKKGKAKK